MIPGFLLSSINLYQLRYNGRLLGSDEANAGAYKSYDRNNCTYE